MSEEDGRFLRVLVATRGAKSILEIGAASGYSGIWLGLGAREIGRPRRRHRVRPAAREGSRGERQAGRPGRRRARRARRRVQGDPEAAGHVRLRVPRRLEAGLQEVLRHGLPAADAGRPLRRAQRRQQEERDGAVPARRFRATPALFTTIVSPSGEGMSVSYKMQAIRAEQTDEARPHHRRAARSRRRPPRRRHGAVGVPHCRPRRADRARSGRQVVDKGNLPAPIPETERRRRHAQEIHRRDRSASAARCTTAAWRRSTPARCRSCSAAITASPPDRWRRAPTACAA